MAANVSWCIGLLHDAELDGELAERSSSSISLGFSPEADPGVGIR
jgi:hypothetical protein